MIIRSNKQVEKEYREKPAISSSRLKHIWNLSELNKDPITDNLSLFVGNYLDLFTSFPDEALKAFLSNYFILDDDKYPKIKKLKELIEKLASEQSYDCISDIPDNILIEAKDNLKYTNIKTGDKLVKLLDDIKTYTDYYKALKSGKMIVPENILKLADNKARKYQTFLNKKYKNQILIAQQPIYVEYNGATLKILPDFIVVDELAKTIQLIDTKSTGSLSSFRKIAKNLKYKVQAAYYHFVMGQAIKEKQKLTFDGKTINLEEYDLMSFFDFIVIDDELNIEIYEVDEESLIYYQSDESNKFNILESIELYQFHLKWDNFNETKYKILNNKELL